MLTRDSARTASRSELRDSPRSAARSASRGRRSPARSAPDVIMALIFSMASSVTAKPCLRRPERSDVCPEYDIRDLGRLTVLNLLEVARLRTAARRAELTDITAAGHHIQFAPVELPDSRQVRVQRLYPKTVLKPAVRTMLVPVPKIPRDGQPPRGTAIGGAPLRDTAMLGWRGE